jgi:uncharacterized protein (TIGR00645 family)
MKKILARLALVSESFQEESANIIFAMRWCLVPMYIGLYFALAVYIANYFIQIALQVQAGWDFDHTLLWILQLVDMIMVAHLVVMTGTSGFSIFVKEYDYKKLPNRPRYLRSMNSTTQKVKMGVSIMAISLVHLLKTFLEATTIPWGTILKEGFLFILFTGGTISFCVIYQMLHSVPDDPAPGESEQPAHAVPVEAHAR